MAEENLTLPRPPPGLQRGVGPGGEGILTCGLIWGFEGDCFSAAQVEICHRSFSAA